MRKVAFIFFAPVVLIRPSISLADEPMSAGSSNQPGAPRWEAPWDPGALYLPPVGSLDLLYRHVENERGEEHIGAVSLSIPLEDARGPVASGPALAPSPEWSARVISESTSAMHEARFSKSQRLLRLSRAVIQLVRENSPELRQMGEVDLAQSRSRTSGLLPELRLRGAHGFDQSVSPNTSGIYAAPLTTRGGWDTAFEVRLTFRLARLLFDDGEASLLSMKQKLHAQVEARVEEAVQSLAKLHAALRRLTIAEPESEEQLRALLAKDEALLVLDALTNGAAVPLIEKYLGNQALAEPDLGSGEPGKSGAESRPD